ncbi:MAG: BsuPI-related putative proteinase inhibitor [Candidatus Cryosericum sp.]
MKSLLIAMMIAVLALTPGVRQVGAADPAVGIRYAPPTVTLTTGKLAYMPGEAIDWRCTLYNGNDHPLVLTFMTSQMYDLIVRQGGKVIARWSTGQAFADIVTTRTVMMGETMSLSGVWQLPEKLAGGTCELEFVLTSTATEPIGATTEFEVGEAGIPGLTVKFVTDKLIYRVGTPATVRCTLTNLTSSPMVLTFPTTQEYDWTITDAKGGLVYRWSAGKAFAQVVTHLTIPAGAGDSFESSWDIPRDLKPSGFYVYFTVLDDNLGVLKTQRCAVLMGDTPPPR